MNDIIKLIFFNILLCVSLYYDKRIGILFIILMSIYWLTIQCSVKNKLVEGFGFFDNFVKIPEFSKYDYSPSLPNSILYNSENQGFQVYFHS